MKKSHYIDALILTGGGDISHQIAQYEMEDGKMPPLLNVSMYRDINEMLLLKDM
jgi:gamma-glutamyl-gamma-aminobutyrate hydrolase PuuD